MRYIAIPESWRGRALVVTDVDDPRSWFLDGELEFAPRLERRRHDWMLARIAAKQLAFDLALCDDPRAFVVTRSRGLSLSHSKGFGAAAIDERGCGIDIEAPRDVNEGAAHLFLRDDEAEAMRACTIAHRLIHFWSAKETAWKRESERYATLKQLPLKCEEELANGLLFDCVETFDAGPVIVALTRPTS